MKFRKGNLVEVLKRDDGPWGSWFPATVISAEGDYYIVRYKSVVDNEGLQVVEKVERKAVRREPPHQKGKRWSTGDVAEVFDDRRWRVGWVAEVLRNNNLFIRFFGSRQLKEFCGSNLRVRQAWHDNKWTIIRKGAQDKGFPNNFTLNNPDCALDQFFQNPGHVNEQGRETNVKMCAPKRIKNNSGDRHHRECFQNSVSRRCNNKRKSAVYSGGCDKVHKRSLQVDDTCGLRLGVRLNRKFVEQSAQVGIGTSSSFLDACRPFCYTDERSQCSVASCSSNDAADYPEQRSHDLPDNSYAESSVRSLNCERTSMSLPMHKPEIDIHDLELRAYKSTMEALHASGPLSWDQEFLLTNLRLFLNISDEEHLVQLRCLLSTQVL